jgi:hypothetical protein
MRWDASRGTSTGWRPAVSNIMPEPHRHGCAELLRLVGAVRHIAHDRTIEPDDAMRRIRDAFVVYDGIFDDDC